jgi:hypothetical protein
MTDTVFSDTVKATAVVKPPFGPLSIPQLSTALVLTLLTVLLNDLNNMASDVLKKCISPSQNMTITDNSGWTKFNPIYMGLTVYIYRALSVHTVHAEVVS